MADESNTDPDLEGRLAPGTKVVHIGTHKTGTTGLQASLHHARASLLEHGVTLPSPDQHPGNAYKVAVGWAPLSGTRAHHQRRWDKIAAAAAAEHELVSVLSSEYLVDAKPDRIRRIISEVGGEPVHVVLTVRPLVGLLASQWQQYVQSGLHASYEEWLDGMLMREPYREPTRSFWTRHRHDAIVERWTEVVGAENMTVIVVDTSAPERLLRDFEHLVGLPEGLLEVHRDRSNRSLTYGEVEMVRAFNQAFDELTLPKGHHVTYIRRGALARLKAEYRPSKGEARIPTPAWAVERAAQVGKEIADGIERSGVNVLGDISLLREYTIEPAETPSEAPTLPAEAAARALLGAVAKIPGPVVAPKPVEKAAAPPVAPPVDLVSGVSAGNLLRALAEKARRRVGRD